ncbi:MAG: hypothetical protein E7277_02625 [Lachnospiraceae bacterium]|jgi:lysophospholipase L1-like esterase|nr:hypothetical protein [Lachnospiraceae bacterium]
MKNKNMIRFITLCLCTLFVSCIIPPADTQANKSQGSLPRVTITGVLAYENGTNIIHWKKVANATSYEVYRSTQKTSGYKKLKKITGTAAKDKSAKALKTYYYKVRAISHSNGPWSKAVSVKTRQKANRIALLGDSVASGFDVYNILRHNEKSYATVSRRVSTVASRDLGTCINYHPDRVYIMVGTNDCVGNGSTRTLRNSMRPYKRMVRRLVSANPNIEIVLMGIGPTRNASNVSNATVNRFNKLVKGLTKEKGDIHYFPTPSYLRDSSGSLAAGYAGADGIHWTPSAYRKVYKKLLKFVKKW